MTEILTWNLPFVAAWSFGAIILASQKAFQAADVATQLISFRVYFWSLLLGLLIPSFSVISATNVALPYLQMQEVFVDNASESAVPIKISELLAWLWPSVAGFLVLTDVIRLIVWIRGLHAHSEPENWPDGFTFEKNHTDLYRLNCTTFSPCTYSWGRNKVFIPAGLFADRIKRDLVLKHEMSHVRNHDFFHALMEQFMKRVWWFLPPVSMLSRQIALLRELRCDLESVHLQDSESYTRLLLEQVQLQMRTAMSPALSTTAQQLKIRIQMMNSMNKSTTNKNGFAFILPLLFGLLAFACDQTITLTSPESVATEATQSSAIDPVFTEVDTPPSLNGGAESLSKHLVFPEDAKNEGVDGRVLVSFVVTDKGTTKAIEVVNMMRLDEVKTRFYDERLAKASIEAVSKLTFEPGILAGKPVSTTFAIPIVFRLQKFSKLLPLKKGSSGSSIHLVTNYPFKKVSDPSVDGC